jgi:2-polyprenyl-6-methoxyphenol hydroxylase-like FAD-dependent oxidoreductase
VLIVDGAAEGANTSRAAVIQARTLEILDSIQVTQRLLAEGVIVPMFTIRDRSTVLARLDFSKLATPYPFTLMLPQRDTERILTERLEELGGNVQRRARVTAVKSGPDGSFATISRSDGTYETIHAAYIVGADGVHSTVREAMGIGFEGTAYEQSFVLADVVMDWPLSAAEVQLFFSPAGLVVVAPLPNGHHRIVATVESAPEHPTLEQIQTLLNARGPGATSVKELIWGSRFRVQHRVAATYRRGEVFLAGDAAHVHSPAGGQGMNTGIQDAVDLAEMLAEALLRGPDTVDLNGYEARRRPVAKRVVSLTDRLTRAATLRGRPSRALRNRLIRIALSHERARTALAGRLAELR